jgi:transposase-like protein
MSESQSQPRRSFTQEFKPEAVRLAQERGNLSAVARDLGIEDSVLQHWKKRLQEGQERPFPGRGNPRQNSDTGVENTTSTVPGSILPAAPDNPRYVAPSSMCPLLVSHFRHLRPENYKRIKEPGREIDQVPIMV